MESCGVGGEETEIADESCILAKLAVAAFFATKSAFLSVSLACLPEDVFSFRSGHGQPDLAVVHVVRKCIF